MPTAVALLLPLAIVGRVHAAEPWQVAGTPAVLTQPVVFQNAGAVLRGTLYRPDVTRRVPAIVAFHAAEVGNADAALYNHLREGLPAIGIAVLIFDRRGSGRSTGSTANVSFQTLADDGIAGARAIARLAAIDPKRIGYWGLSQGGWLAVFAAGRDPNAAFAVSVSAPLVTPELQMEFAMANVLRVNGYPASDLDAMLAARKAWIGYLHGNLPLATAEAALSTIDRKRWFPLMYLPSAKELASNINTSASRERMDADPLAALARVHVPVLFIYGGKDPWTPVAATIERLHTLAQAHSGIEYAVIAGADHDMAFVQHERMTIDAATLQRDVPQAPAYFMLLAAWLARHLS
ncbi:MAG TPA: alpha/beta hydrolase [Candidatus Cybelea sp.]|nr:alpha/beta hydrolase [Candidatus Cybelea sp.]